MSLRSKENLTGYSSVEAVEHEISGSPLEPGQNAIVDLTLEDPLVAHYSFDDQSNVGENTHNPGVYDGTVTGTISGDGIYGAGRVFNGTSDKMDIGNIMFQPNKPWTLAFWVKPDPTGTQNGSMVAQYGGGQSGRFRIYPNFAERIYLDASNYGAVFAENTAIYDGNYHHLAFTYEGTNVYSIHVDSNLSASGTLSGPLYQTNTIIAQGDIYFKGEMDDIRFYDRVLTGDEIKHLYRPGIKETLGDPTVQYDFTTVDISGSSYIEDKAGNAHGEINGTLEQFQPYTDYNGNSDYYSSSPELKITGAQTWCFEIYIERSGHSGGDTVYRIMSNKGSSSGFDIRVDTRSASDQLFFADYNLGSTAQTPSFTLFDQWTPIVAHVDGSGNMSLWYNGTEYTATGAEMSTPTEDFYINNVTPVGGTQRQLNARYRNIEIYSGAPSNVGTEWIPGDLTSLSGVTNVLALPKGSPE